MDPLRAMKTSLKYLFPVLLFSLLGLVAARFVPREAAAPEESPLLARPSETDFEITIRTIGTLDAARSHMISSELPGDRGKIIFIVEDGQRVGKGDILVRLDPTPFEEEAGRLKAEAITLQSAVEASEQLLEWEKNQIERELRTAEFNLEIARLEFGKLIEGDGPLQVSQFQEDVEKAREEYDRYLAYIDDLKVLDDRGFDNRTEIGMAEKKASELMEKYESARKKYRSYTRHVFPALRETAKARVEKAEMELDQTRKGSVFRVAKAISGLEEIRAKLEIVMDSLRQAEKRIENTKIAAPFSGIAILYETFRDGQKRKPRVGDRVLQNQPLLYLPDVSSMVVETRIREIDLHKTALGQECSVRMDAYPDIIFKGEIVSIGVMATSQRSEGVGEKFFQLTIALREEDARLRPGMTARTSILVDRVEKSTTVPIQAIFEESGADFCYIHDGRNFRKVVVETGRQNEDVVEIVSGLESDASVSLVRPSPDRVRRSRAD
jgi:HlyD family secretion protein